MSSARIIRPFARALQRPATFAAFSSKTAAPVSAHLQVKKPVQKSDVAARIPMDKMTILKAAMPQLVPFYFVNEVTTAFILLPTLIYIFSKYILPQRIRTMCARLFISKL